MNKYIKEFLNLNCASDILDIVKPVNNLDKEITESMAIINVIRSKVLQNPGKCEIIDLCAGNALTSVIASFLLPIKNAIAIDILPRERNWDLINNFEYVKENIYNPNIHQYIGADSILISVHSCGILSERIINIYQYSSNYAHLVVMPCCPPKNLKFNQNEYMRKKVGRYYLWCYDMSKKINGRMTVDNYCLSSKNAIISKFNNSF